MGAHREVATMKRTKILQAIAEKEAAEDWHAHVCPVNTNLKKVKPNYDYMRKSFGCRVGGFFARPIFSFASRFFAHYCKMKIVGKENLALAPNGAIITSNHINNIDCALLRHATRGHKLDITVGEFNNYKGVFGSLLRSAGAMPFSDNSTCMRNLTRAIKARLADGDYIVFYPEGSLWWCYEKPRPLLDGAYFYAAKNNVPVIPMFFTFEKLKQRRDGTYKLRFILHIGKPLFPDPALPTKENVANLRDANFAFNQATYNEFYGIDEGKNEGNTAMQPIINEE